MIKFHDSHDFKSVIPEKPLERRLEHAILRHGAEVPGLLDNLRSRDPGSSLYFAIQGIVRLFSGRPSDRTAMRASLAKADLTLGDARGDVYIEVLRRMIDGLTASAADLLEYWCSIRPEDVLAAKLCASLRFMAGDIAGIASVTGRSVSALSPDTFGYGYLLGCHAFALEEMGDYSAAERLAGQAMQYASDDVWALHALVHVHTTMRNPGLALALIRESAPTWRRCGTFSRHIAWHGAILLVSNGLLDEALEQYDAVVSANATDDYRDIANSASLLWYLEKAGVDCGVRWSELSCRVRRRVADGGLVFAVLHDLLVLLRARHRVGVAGAFEELVGLTRGRGDQGDVAAAVGLDVAKFLIHPRPGAWTVEKARGVLERLECLGGSRIQRDYFVLQALDRAVAARLWDVAETIRAFRAAPASEDSRETAVTCIKNRQSRPNGSQYGFC